MSKKEKRTIPDIEKSIRKDYGDILVPFTLLEETAGRIINTTLSLDLGLGGGISEGTLISISGNSGSGKSTLALTIAANAQKLFDKKIYYFDVEGRLRPELIKTIKHLNLDPEHFQIIKSVKGKFLTAEDFLNILLNILTSEPNVMCIIDSIAMMCTEDNQAKKTGENKKMMAIPGLMYEALRKLSQVLPAMQSNIISITHLQANPTAYGGPSEVGGNAVKFQASTRLMCLSSQEIPQDGDKTGRISEFKILKSSLGPGTGKQPFYIKYGSGYDYERDLVNTARDMGLLELAGSWYTFMDEKNEEVKLQGENAVINFLKENTSFATSLENKIRSMV